MKLLGHVREATADISECGTYRYDLTRTWDSRPKALWIMLNPSTAAVDVDDPTVRRTQTFAFNWGCGGVVVCNLFALRSTNPKALWEHDDPIGPDNDRVINRWARDLNVGLVVAAWGANKSVDRRADRVAEIVGGELWCLGMTKQGHPRHPLYVRGDTELVRWREVSYERLGDRLASL